MKSQKDTELENDQSLKALTQLKEEKMAGNSVDSDRAKRYRQRMSCVKRLQRELSEDALWETVIAFQNYPFKTMRGLPFSYVLKVGRSGEYNRELIVNRRKDSKSLAWSSVRLAFNKAKERQGEVVPKPKALGDIRGISYVYAMFLRFGIIDGGQKA